MSPFQVPHVAHVLSKGILRGLDPSPVGFSCGFLSGPLEETHYTRKSRAVLLIGKFG